MAIKNICQHLLLCLGILTTFAAHAQDSPFGQTFQINTHLNSFIGKPSWLLIIRDVETGQVLPYLYDFNTTDNFWLGFTYAHTYQVTVSDLEFGPPNATIHNFCHLQNGILNRESFTINLTGDLTPDRHTSYCHVFKYKEFDFPVVETESNDTTPEPSTSNNTATTTSTTTTTENNPNPIAAITKAVGNNVTSNAAANLGSIVSNALSGNLTK